MEIFDHLKDGYLPGWPGRTQYMSTTAGAQLLRFVPGGDQIVPITDTYSVTLKAEKRFNYLLGESEKGSYKGNLQAYYLDFLYDLLGEAQKRVMDCLHGDKQGQYRALSDSYFRMRRCLSGKGEKNFAQ